MAKADLSEFEALSKPRKPPCAVCKVLEGRSPAVSGEDLESLKAALATEQNVITNAAIAKWLAVRGHQVHSQRVLSHRKGLCSGG
jgi:hypothetical protein